MNSLQNNTELINLADEFLRNTDWILNDIDNQGNRKNVTFNPLKDIKLDLNRLREIQKEHKDVRNARSIPDNDNRYTYKKKKIHLYKLIKKINEIEKSDEGYYVPSGFYYYPPGGACGWHTNSNSIGKRIYLTYAKEENKSFFRYYDNNKEDIVTKYDKKGWTINKFNIDNEKNLFWHCVGSDTNRISIGFKLEKDGLINKDIIDIYDEYLTELSNNVIVKKSDNAFKNFLCSKYYTTFYSNNDIIKNQKPINNYIFKLIDIDDIFTSTSFLIPLSDIYWKNKNEEKVYFHKDIDINFPVTLLLSDNNPLGLPFICIDGNERLSKIASLNIRQLTIAFIIDNITFFNKVKLIDQS